MSLPVPLCEIYNIGADKEMIHLEEQADEPPLEGGGEVTKP